MKSPNHRLSYLNLIKATELAHLAKELLANTTEDIKNDERLRNDGYPDNLRAAISNLKDALNQMDSTKLACQILGYHQ